jgi:hypothetical protein
LPYRWAFIALALMSILVLTFFGLGLRRLANVI